MRNIPTARDPVIGPDRLEAHAVVTYKLPGGIFETMIWRYGDAAPREEWQNEDWNDAIVAHSVAWYKAQRLETLRRKHGK